MKRRVVAVLVLGFSISCADQWVEEPPQAPWSRVLRNRNELLLQLEEGRRVDDCVDLGGFGALRPAAHWEAGFEKSVPRGVVRVERRLVQSEGESTEVWELRFLPKDETAETILSAEVLDLLARWRTVRSVAVSDSEQTAVVTLDSGRVQSVYWARQGAGPFK